MATYHGKQISELTDSEVVEAINYAEQMMYGVFGSSEAGYIENKARWRAVREELMFEYNARQTIK